MEGRLANRTNAWGSRDPFSDTEVASPNLRGSGWSDGVENLYRDATDVINIIAYV